MPQQRDGYSSIFIFEVVFLFFNVERYILFFQRLWPYKLILSELSTQQTSFILPFSGLKDQRFL